MRADFASLILLMFLVLCACGDDGGDAVVLGENVAWPIEQVSSAEIARIERLFQTSCASCHDGGINEAPLTSALRRLSEETIHKALQDGVMSQQGASLTPKDRQAIAQWLSDTEETPETELPACKAAPVLQAETAWPRWGAELANTRYLDSISTEINGNWFENASLEWVFGLPGAARARSQPVVTGDVAFFGSQSGTVYAIDLSERCQYWRYEAGAEVRSSPTLWLDDVSDPMLVFGDFDAHVHAVSAVDGALIWRQDVRDHPDGTITGSLTVAGGQVFVPMSSREVVSAFDPAYPCCTFRGGITALDLFSGEMRWRFFTTDEAQRQGENTAGTEQFGPSGAPVWSVPTADLKRGLLYIGTGQNYSTPANDLSSAILALRMDDGSLAWATQTVPEDAWNASCLTDKVNCPDEHGPDFDFGAAPILVDLDGGGSIILAGQKSGEIFGIDPDRDGDILWRRKVGRGGYSGGVHWGMATDGQRLFVGIADNGGHETAQGPRRPGMHAFDVTTGEPLWSTPEPAYCDDHLHACQTNISAAITAVPGAVIAGGLDGRIKAYHAVDGSVLWSFDTNRSFQAENDVQVTGGSIDSSGPIIAGDRMVINSGYDKFGQIPGNALLIFRSEGN
ncbi:MAG: PQQ-binding-like beta-propeller repeat protein [Pseudomonadota bacterium]